MRTRRIATVGALVAVVALSAAGCGSSNGSASQGSTTTNKATGSPITIGYINEENDPASSYPDIREGANAAVQYINGLGGIDGHPIKLDVCITQLSSGGAQCAQQMVQDKVRAVTGGINLTSTQIWPVLKQAGIPFFGTFPVFAADSSADGNHFYFGGGNQATFPGAAKYIAQHAKRIDVLTANVTTSEIQALTEAVMKANGATSVNYVPAPQGQADYSSYLAQIQKDNPDAVLVVFPTPDCVKIMQEAQSVGLKAQMYYISQCAGVQTFATAGSAAVGARFILDTLSFGDTGNPQVATFQKAMNAAGQSQNIDGFSQDGFMTVMNLFALIKKAGDATSTAASIRQAALATTNEPSFMGPNYSCANPPIKGAGAVCGNGGRIAQLQSDGKTLQDVGGAWLTAN